MLHVNSVNSVNSANSYSAVLPPSPRVFLVKSLYLGGLTFQFLGLPIGPLGHRHIAPSKTFFLEKKAFHNWL